MKGRPLPRLLLAALLLPISAGALERYTGTINGQPAELRLDGPATALRGQLVDPTVQLEVRGSAGADGRLSLELRHAGLAEPIGQADGRRDAGGVALTLRFRHPQTGETSSVEALLLRQPAATAPAEAGPGTRDPRLVGRWVHEQVTSSPGGVGAASFATRLSTEFGADGRLRQTSLAAGGGGDWSWGGGESLVFAGQWRTAGDVLQVRGDGSADWVEATRYRFVDARLITEDGSGRRIWSRASR